MYMCMCACVCILSCTLSTSTEKTRNILAFNCFLLVSSELYNANDYV